jgi:hypothetical protein
MRPRLQWHGGQHVAAGHMMLEGGSFTWRQRLAWKTVQVTNEITLAVTCHPVPQNEVVHPSANVYRINLDEAVVIQCGSDIMGGLVKQQGSTMKASGVDL